MKSTERATCVGETEKEQMQIIIIISFFKKKKKKKRERGMTWEV
jgi:hypothetical protein